MKVSFICTVFNEEKTIEQFLHSLFAQSKLPDEIIIVDGGSTDDTVKELSEFAMPDKGLHIKLITKPGNRSVGRNEAIKNATGDVIACSDAGNVLDKDWLKHIVAPFSEKNVDVVAGYYEGRAKTVWQKCVIPYALVMPDRVDANNFLPATRSMAFRKQVWEKLGGFDQRLSHNEDYVFARKIRENGFVIRFVKDAIVYWFPPSSVRQTFRTFWRFALGDAEAGIYRPKVTILFARYVFAIILLFLNLKLHIEAAKIVFIVLLLFYILWSIQKNYRYVKNWQAIYMLPFLQVMTDIAVLSGTVQGLLHFRKNTS